MIPGWDDTDDGEENEVGEDEAEAKGSDEARLANLSTSIYRRLM